MAYITLLTVFCSETTTTSFPMASVFCADSDNFLLTCERGVGGGGRGVSKFSTAINGSKPLTCPSQFDKFRPTTGKLLIPLPLPPFHFFKALGTFKVQKNKAISKYWTVKTQTGVF